MSKDIKSGNEYTLAVINLKFNYTYKFENGKPIKIVRLAVIVGGVKIAIKRT